MKILAFDLEKSYKEELNKKELLIQELKGELKIKETEEELAVKNAILEKEKEIDSLVNKMEISKNEYLLKENSLRENYEEKLKNKDEQIQ